MFSYGFYNSLNHDRKYDAKDFSTLIDCLITDGVFQNVGGFFSTIPGTGMQVIVRPGLAWFDHTWNNNDASMPLNLASPDVTQARFDAVILEINESDRTNTIRVLTGMPDVVPTKPILTNTESVHQHVLAYVRVPGGATSIVASDIEIMVGQSACPFVTTILQTTNIDVLFAKWEEEFNTWFNRLNLQLEGDVATNLQLQINKLTDNVITDLQRQINELAERGHKLLSGGTIPTSSLGADGDIYVKTR